MKHLFQPSDMFLLANQKEFAPSDADIREAFLCTVMRCAFHDTGIVGVVRADVPVDRQRVQFFEYRCGMDEWGELPPLGFRLRESIFELLSFSIQWNCHRRFLSLLYCQRALKELMESFAPPKGG